MKIFQHEIDHLDGVLYVDRASKVREIKPENIQDNVSGRVNDPP